MSRNRYESYLAEHGYRLYRPHRTLLDARATRRERRAINRALRSAARLASFVGWSVRWR